MTTVWRGSDEMRTLLRPLHELREHPGNPRRGDVDAIRASLRRFGQQRPILVDADGMIVAGHHVARAATAEEWTHVAAVTTDLTAAEADAFLLADNRTGDLGYYDEEALAARLEEIDSLDGTGYSDDDVAALLSSLDGDTLTRAPTAADPSGQPYATGEATEFQIVLSYERAEHQRVAFALDRHRAGDETNAETLLRVLRERR